MPTEQQYLDEAENLRAKIFDQQAENERLRAAMLEARRQTHSLTKEEDAPMRLFIIESILTQALNWVTPWR